MRIVVWGNKGLHLRVEAALNGLLQQMARLTTLKVDYLTYWPRPASSTTAPGYIQWLHFRPQHAHEARVSKKMIRKVVLCYSPQSLKQIGAYRRVEMRNDGEVILIETFEGCGKVWL